MRKLTLINIQKNEILKDKLPKITRGRILSDCWTKYTDEIAISFGGL